MEKFPGNIRSKSPLAVTMQLGPFEGNTEPLCASVSLSLNRNTFFLQLTFWNTLGRPNVERSQTKLLNKYEEFISVSALDALGFPVTAK